MTDLSPAAGEAGASGAGEAIDDEFFDSGALQTGPGDGDEGGEGLELDENGEPIEGAVADDELDDFEDDGKTYKVPKSLIPRLMKDADYTQKTQALAAERQQVDDGRKLVIEQATNRTDLPAADLIRDAEDRLNADLRLRVMETEVPLLTVAGSRFVAMPGSFLAPLALWRELASGRQELRFVPAAISTVATAAPPLYWTIDGANLAFERPSDQAYPLTFRYLQRFALGPAAPATTNYLLTTWPSVYRAAVMIEAALWLQDDDQARRWEVRYAEALRLVKKAEAKSRALATLRVDVALQRIGRGHFNMLTGDCS